MFIIFVKFISTFYKNNEIVRNKEKNRVKLILLEYLEANNFISAKLEFENIYMIHYYNNCISTQKRWVLTKSQ